MVTTPYGVNRPDNFTAQTTRLIAPDFARGIMLLGIALANGTTAWVNNSGVEQSGAYGGVVNDSLLDKFALVFAAMFVHVRGLPMFATLLGLGVGLISASLWRRNYPLPRARRVIIRRYFFLGIFGAVHLVFLFFGDIMLAYGICGLILGALISVKNKGLLWIAGVLWGFWTLGSVVIASLTLLVDDFQMGFSGAHTGGSEDFGALDGLSVFFNGGADTYLGDVEAGALCLLLQIPSLAFTVPTILPAMLIGVVMARRGVLSRVQEHRKELNAWIVAGAVVVLMVGLPWGLSQGGFLPQEWAPALETLNGSLGWLTGPAAVALIALMCEGWQQRVIHDGQYQLPACARACMALGSRSMTGYVLQSVVFILLTKKYTLALGTDQGACIAMVISAGVWLITLLVAAALQAVGRRGPLEWLHRHLSYGKKGLTQNWAQTQAPHPVD